MHFKSNKFIRTLDLEILEIEKIIPKNSSNDSKHIVLIHGFSTNKKSWKLFLEKNENNYIYLLNLPGHGSKQYLRYHLEFDYIIDVIHKFILDLNKEIVLIGHSFGAAISLVINNKLKENNLNVIKKLILLAPYTKYSITKVYNKISLFNIKSIDDFLQLQKNIFQHPNEIIEKLEKYFYKNETMIFFKKNLKYLKYIIFQMSKPSTFFKIDESIKKINNQTYLLLGENDKFVPCETLKKKFRKIYNDLYISVYPNTGHAFFVEENEKFFNEIDKILNNN